MSTKALVPGNSQRARLTALSAFERFAKDESMSVTQISEYIGADSSGTTLYVVLDKFAVYIAFKESCRGTLLSKNSVASYFGNVKNHLLEAFPGLEAASGRRVQKIASVLDKYCAKRGTDFTRQAPPYTKIDLQMLITTIYKAAAIPDDYKDACLLALLWYLFGRSSDMMCLLKTQVAVYPGGCLYINFKRIKSAASLGASIYYDLKNFASCPVHALAVATIMHETPSEFLLDHIPNNIQDKHSSLTSSTPLLELLQNAPPGAANINSPPRTSAISVPGIQAHVNRVLQRWSSEAIPKVTQGLTSHSFRRGAAQNANADNNISTPWILDRGGWSMTSVSKAFNYIVSTTHEDQKVAKTLAGWSHNDEPHLPTLQAFDPVVTPNIRRLQASLFACAHGVSERLDFCEDVLELLMAVAILHYHDMVALADSAPYVTRVRQSMNQLSISETEIAAWSLTIRTDLIRRKAQPSPQPNVSDPTTADVVAQQAQLVERQTRVIETLTEQMSALNRRLLVLEHAGAPAITPPPPDASTILPNSTPVSRIGKDNER